MDQRQIALLMVCVQFPFLLGHIGHYCPYFTLIHRSIPPVNVHKLVLLYAIVFGVLSVFFQPLINYWFNGSTKMPFLPVLVLVCEIIFIQIFSNCLIVSGPSHISRIEHHSLSCILLRYFISSIVNITVPPSVLSNQG